MMRKMRTTGVAIMSLVLLTTMVASPSVAATKPAKITIGFVAVNLNSPSITRIKDTFVKAAQARGWKVSVFDGQGDQNATNNAATNFINQGVSAIVNDASPNTQMTAVMEKAKAKKIPFVSIYGGYVPQVSAEIGTNEFINASLITAEMVNRLGGKGRILALNWLVLQALKDRDAGMHAVLSQNPGVQLVKQIDVKVPGQVDDAYNQVTNILTADKNIDAILIGWDELAPPVVRAITQAGLQKKIFVVGFDGNPFAWDMIRAKSPYVMEPANPFEPMGAKAVSTIVTLLAGKTLSSKIIYMKPCLITVKTVPAKGKFPNWATCPFFPGEINN